MKWIKWILWPFSLLFGIITFIRRYFYNKGIFKRTESKSFSIVVGNITVGGTGKTPITKWLARQMAINYSCAVLSRGYGRKTKGFLEVLDKNKPGEVGDESLEMRLALPKSVRNFVCENRVSGIEKIEQAAPAVEVIILDDAYQHLQLKANFYILLCDYTRPFLEDYPMPGGRLREFKQAAKYCSAIVITKCPISFSVKEGLEWSTKLGIFGKPVFFSSFHNSVPTELESGEKLMENQNVIVVSGLAVNETFVQWATTAYNVKATFLYPDHCDYTLKDYTTWSRSALQTDASGILTTAKDVVKIKEFSKGKSKVYVTETNPIFHFGGDDALIQLLLKKIER